MTALDSSRLSRRTLLKRSAAVFPAIAGASDLTSAREGRFPAVTKYLTQGNSQEELVAGNTAFALDLYAEERKTTNGNLLFSPYSISLALAMTYLGASGETAAQMADTLSFRLGQPALHETFSALNTDLAARGNAEEDVNNRQVARGLRIANALWGEQTYPFSQSFSGQIERYYGPDLQQSDFINDPDQTRDQINDWVAEQTEDHIQDIVPEGAITSLTRLVLANAIYFYGGWESTFFEQYTADGNFFLVDGTTVTIPFMSQQRHLPYVRGDGYQVIEFSYAASGYAFTVFLPDEGQFAPFEEGLGSDLFNAAIMQLQYSEVLVYLPKFNFEYGASLKNTLQTMGVANAFDPVHADFTGMMDETPPEPLYISDVLHKAFISVDENGTEAAAATIVEIASGSAAPAGKPPEVHIDRPFFFTIRDTQTGTLLFLGRVMNPTA